jgi:outer membrane immunogenic protein
VSSFAARVLSCVALICAATPSAVAGFTGAYAGGYLANTKGQSDWSGVSRPELSPTGTSAGVLAGVMFDAGLLAAGIEADLSYTGASDTSLCADPLFSCKVDLDFAGSLRARAGTSVGPALVYGTAGVAFRGVSTTTTELIPSESSDFLLGWTMGAGAEISVLDRFRLGVEYRHSAYADASEISPSVSPGDFGLTVDEVYFRVTLPLQ